MVLNTAARVFNTRKPLFEHVFDTFRRVIDIIRGVINTDGRSYQQVIDILSTLPPPGVKDAHERLKKAKRAKKSWNMITGTPMMCGFGGGVMAVIPAFGSISAFSPELIGGKVPARAAMAIKEVLQKFGLSAFASARVEA